MKDMLKSWQGKSTPLRDQLKPEVPQSPTYDPLRQERAKPESSVPQTSFETLGPSQLLVWGRERPRDGLEDLTFTAHRRHEIQCGNPPSNLSATCPCRKGGVSSSSDLMIAAERASDFSRRNVELWPGLASGTSLARVLAFRGPDRQPPPSVSARPNCTEFRDYYKQLLDIYLVAISFCSMRRNELRDFEDISPGTLQDTPCQWISEEIQRLQSTEGVLNPPPPSYGQRLADLNTQYAICAGSILPRTMEEYDEARAAGREYRARYLRDQVRRCNLYLELLEYLLNEMENRFREYGCSGALY